MVGQPETYSKRAVEEGSRIVAIVLSLGLVLLVGIAFLMFVMPQYSVWSHGLRGKAKLAEANYERQTLVSKARAELEAAALYADAEVRRAKGAAISARLIGESLERNPNYLQYLAIQSQKSMADSPNHTTVYIPTGASGLPLVKTVP